MKKLLFLVLLLFFFADVNGQDTWTQKAEFGGVGRAVAVSFSIGNFGYIGTGLVGTDAGNSANLKNDFWAYDPANDTWSQKANFGGLPRYDAVGFSIGTKGYIGTGWAGFPVGELVDFWEYDPPSNTWTRKADLAGGRRESAVGFSIGNKGYIGVGAGDHGKTFTDLWEYDPSADGWTRKADFPGGNRANILGCSIGNKGYVGLGVGLGSTAGIIYKDFWEYDPTNDAWAQKADFGGGYRRLATGISVSNKAYVGLGSDNTNYYNDFWEYNPATNRWTKKANFGGNPRWSTAGFSIGGKGYLGVGNDGNIFRNDFLEYTPPCDQSCSSPNFSIGNGFAYNSDAVFLATGDFNEDGKIDIAMANNLSSNVSVVLGDGTGNFGSPNYFSVGGQSEPTSIALGDFNGDGHVDLATANLASGTFSILLGDGHGNFTFTIVYTTSGVSPRTIISGDWNGDHKIDLAVTNQLSNSVDVWLGNGNGSFQAMATISAGNRAVQVTRADFNSDGKADFAISNRFDNNITVVLGNGDGTFAFHGNTSIAAGSEPFNSVAADFNNDGKVDLAVKMRSGSVSVLLGDGTGSFSSQTSLPAFNNFNALGVGDFNNDGYLDILTDNPSSSSLLFLYLGNGSGNFPTVIQPLITTRNSGSGSFLLITADYNQDGKLDAATPGYPYLNTCTLPVLPTWYTDADGDGYGTGVFVTQCDRPVHGFPAAELTATSGDCDDTNASVYPGAPETCNGIDDNCDGQIDEGQQGKALHFDGVDDYVKVGVRSNLEMSSVVTMEAWIYPTGAGRATTEGGIIVNREGEYEFARFSDGTIRFAFANSSPGWNWINTGYIALLNQWTHIAITYSANDGVVKLYANGTEVFSSPVSGNIGDIPLSASEDDFWIGARQRDQGVDKYHQNFNGIIEEVRIWNSVLSASTIKQWMNKTVTSNHPSFANLQGYWQFDEGVGTATADASGHGNTGTLFNSPVWVPSTVPINLNTFYQDADSDGFGNPTFTIQTCFAPNGYVADNTDCDDNNAAINPNTKWYTDADGDHYGTGVFVAQCARPTNGFLATELTATTGDCDDNNNQVWQSATLYKDQDGDGYTVSSGETICYGAAIPAGYSAAKSAEDDCNDNDNTVWQLALLYKDTDGDGYDNGQESVCYGSNIPPGHNTTTLGPDCNDNDNTKHASFSFYVDGDEDGYGTGLLVQVCAVNATTPPTGYSANNADCDDGDNTIWQSQSLYIDGDGDGYTNGQQTVCYGSVIPSGYSATSAGSDCDDGNNAVWRTGNFYVDADGDGYTVGGALQLCYGNTTPAGYAATQSAENDCNDGHAARWQSATLYVDADGDTYTVGDGEVVCYGASIPSGYSSTKSATDDCDDNNADMWRTGIFYQDGDGDGYTVGNSVSLCYGASTPSGYSDTRSTTDDCNDGDAGKWQSATLYTDNDGDGFTTGSGQVVCYGNLIPAGFSSTRSDPDDCNDNNAAVWQAQTLYVDQDNDGYTVGSGEVVCYGAAIPEGYSPIKSTVDDCNDNNATVWQVQTWYQDADGDGYAGATQSSCDKPAGPGWTTTPVPVGDCDEGNNTIWQTGIFYTDADDDDYTVGGAVTLCFGAATPAGYSATKSSTDDCNDGNKDVWESAVLYVDADEDSYTVGSGVLVCYGASIPPSYRSTESAVDDCNDGDGAVWQSKLLYIDGDGDGYDNGQQTVCYGANIPTGFALTTNGPDCNDGNNTVWRAGTFYKDGDNDGYTVGSGVSLCYGTTTPAGYRTTASSAADCDDANAGIGPAVVWYLDKDNDGYYTGSGVLSCTSPGTGYKTSGLLGGNDCNDNDASINPSTAWVVDKDKDGYYIGSAVIRCTSPGSSYVKLTTQQPGDCNDADAGINPAAVEVCGNKIDDNCNGKVDETGCANCTNGTNLMTTNITSNSATLNWTAAANPVQWQVQYKAVANGSKWVDVAVSRWARSVTLSNLKANQAYIWHIRAKCGNSWTSYNDAAIFRTLPLAALTSVSTGQEPVKGVVESTTERRIEIYPNPGEGQYMISIRLPEPLSAEATLQVIDLRGKVVQTERGSFSKGYLQQRLLLSGGLAKGMYLVRIVVQGANYQAKLIYLK